MCSIRRGALLITSACWPALWEKAASPDVGMALVGDDVRLFRHEARERREVLQVRADAGACRPSSGRGWGSGCRGSGSRSVPPSR